ncbi:hypothetical protein cgR_6047 [Corynebacterium glutamicum R]|uniref:Uncharacterized protein n=1 Tax=Corynebacterium glutamicum (strain R) TaxID=340322 RepID=A0AB72VF22_CORGB|nr:hypothetical protein cgR_6047 [Corynebacterium glutamicum R]
MNAQSLFSAHAEVFPVNVPAAGTVVALLRTRGGISGKGEILIAREFSSPHTRRYFLLRISKQHSPKLFSAHAEVFPTHADTDEKQGTLLRTRGGISNILTAKTDDPGSSPHTRRYFLRPGRQTRPQALFSAHAEVFPTEPS